MNKRIYQTPLETFIQQVSLPFWNDCELVLGEQSQVRICPDKLRNDIGVNI